MPKSRVAKSKMFRESSKLHDRYVGKNYMKNIRRARNIMKERYDLNYAKLEFLIWAYDLEFFTLEYIGQELKLNPRKYSESTIFPLSHKGLVYKHFDKLTSANDPDAYMFREETKFQYRVRYAITQKARLIVQDFYRELEA